MALLPLDQAVHLTSVTDIAATLGIYAVVIVIVGLALVGVVFRIAMVQATTMSGTATEPTAKINCPKCGARIPDDQEPCEYCGKKRPASNESVGWS